MFKKKYNIETQTRFLTQGIWVKKVIDSCETMEQMEASDRLTMLFVNKYKDKVNPELFRKFSHSLFHTWIEKAKRFNDEEG